MVHFRKQDFANVNVYIDTLYVGTIHTFPGKLGIKDTESKTNELEAYLNSSKGLLFHRIADDNVEILSNSGEVVAQINCCFGQEKIENGKKKARVPEFKFEGTLI